MENNKYKKLMDTINAGELQIVHDKNLLNELRQYQQTGRGAGKTSFVQQFLNICRNYVIFHKDGSVERIHTEDAEFEIISPKQLPNAKED